MRPRPDPLGEAIPPELLLSMLDAPGQALYLSHGYGPWPTTRADEPPQHVRVAVTPGAPLAAVQAAGEAWLAAARPVAPWPLLALDADELAAPSAGSSWAAIAEAERAALLVRGAELLVGLAPEIAVFHLTEAQGGVLLARVRASLATGTERMDAIVLEHLMFAAITARRLKQAGEAVVVAEARDSTWSIRQAFPEHAPVWRRALASAPLQHLGGLGFALLAELAVRATLAARAGAPGPAQPPEIAEALAAAGAMLAPRIVNLLADGDRHPIRN